MAARKFSTVFYEAQPKEPKVRLNDTRTAAQWLREVFFDTLDKVDREKEHFVSVALNSRNEVKRGRCIAVGCLTGTLVHPREVFLPAVGDSAAAILVAHQHPSGDATPSPEDVVLTERLTDAGRILGIRVVDHVVVGADGYVSVMDLNR